MRVFPIFLFLLLGMIPSLVAQELQTVEDNDPFYQYITNLTKPQNAGRLPGTAGAEFAKDYIINEFKLLNISPISKDSYTNDFNIITMSKYQKDKTRITCATDKNFFQMPSDESYYPAFFSASKTLPDKEVVFVGYGISDEEYDDYGALDLKDKIVLLMRYDYNESSAENYEPSAGAVLNTKLKIATEKGACAVLIFNGFNSKQQGSDDIFYRPRFYFTNKEDQNQLPFFFLKHEAINVIEQATNLNFSDIQKEIDTKKQPKSFLIPNFRMQLKCSFEETIIKTSNVAGIIWGNDNQLRNEFIVVGAHYDHIGNGEFSSRTSSIGGHQIHPGADDNAAGVAVLFELAKLLQRTGPKRSVILVAFTAKEMGLFGSNMFLRQNKELAPKIKAMLNFDMVGCYRENIGLRINGVDTCELFKPSLENTFKNVLKLNYTYYSPAEATTDHASFFEQKIPTLNFFTGFHERYHHTTDIVQFMNFKALRQLTDCCAKFLVDLNNSKEPLLLNPNYKPMPIAKTGITFLKDNNRAKILYIEEDSPAAKAGLLPGDIVLQINQINLLSQDDFLNIVADYSTGSSMPIVIMRETKESIEKIDVVLNL